MSRGKKKAPQRKRVSQLHSLSRTVSRRRTRSLRDGFIRVLPVPLGHRLSLGWKSALARRSSAGFTLLELLLVIAIIVALTGIVLGAVRVQQIFTDSADAEHEHYRKQLESAMYQHLVSEWELLNEVNIPEGEANAKPICTYEVTTDATCVNLDGLIPTYMAALPGDRRETNPNYSGYTVYKNVGRVKVVAAHLGEEVGGGGGGGGPDTTIATCAELQGIEDDLTLSYTIEQDIDCAGFVFEPIGASTAFTGTLDGQDYTISNLAITTPGGYMGLFAQIGAVLNGAGTVKNLTLENINITGGDSAGGGVVGMSLGAIENVHVTSGNVRSDSRAGGVAGLAVGPIRLSSSKADVSGTTATSGVFAGGLVGECGACTIENSFATGNVTAMNTGYGQVGGLLGRNIGGTIRNSYATGNVTGAATGGPSSGAGGLVGFSPLGADIINSFATGHVFGPLDIGGLIGQSYNSPVNSYWFDQAGDDATQCIGSGGGSCSAAAPVSLLYDETHDVYDDTAPLWDFATVWQSNNPVTFPTLRSGGSSLDEGLVAYWKFDDGAGTTISDSSGNGSNGAMTNMDPATAWNTSVAPTSFSNPYALSLDGSDDYVAFGKPAVLNLPTSMTVAAWIHINSFMPGMDMMVFGDPTVVYGQKELRVGSLAGPRLRFFQGHSDLTEGHVIGVTPLSTGQWYHVAAVRDDSAKTLTVYVNGIQDGLWSYAGKNPIDAQQAGDNNLSYSWPNSNNFDGSIDDLRIYNRALSPAEVATLAAL